MDIDVFVTIETGLTVNVTQESGATYTVDTNLQIVGGGANETGALTGAFYPLFDNPSGYLTGISYIKHADFNSNSFIFVGDGAGGGVNNQSSVGLGVNALGSADGLSYNTAVGDSSMAVLTIGGNNTAIGEESMVSYINGRQNTALGGEALAGATHGNNNTAVGFQAGAYSIDGGHDNIMLGIFAGSSLGASDSNNILVGHQGNAGDSRVIRLGTNGTHTGTYLVGTILINDVPLTGLYYPRNNPSGFLISGNQSIVYTSGNQQISGIKTFNSDVIIFSGLELGDSDSSGTGTNRNYFDSRNDGFIVMRAGQGNGNGSESFLYLSDGHGPSDIQDGGGFFHLTLDDNTTSFDLRGQGTLSATFASLGQTRLYLNQYDNDGSDIQSPIILVDGNNGWHGFGQFNPTNVSNRWGRSLTLQAEDNENGGNGGNVILVAGTGTSHGQIILNASARDGENVGGQILLSVTGDSGGIITLNAADGGINGGTINLAADTINLNGGSTVNVLNNLEIYGQTTCDGIIYTNQSIMGAGDSPQNQINLSQIGTLSIQAGGDSTYGDYSVDINSNESINLNSYNGVTINGNLTVNGLINGMVIKKGTVSCEDGADTRVDFNSPMPDDTYFVVVNGGAGSDAFGYALDINGFTTHYNGDNTSGPQVANWTAMWVAAT